MAQVQSIWRTDKIASPHVTGVALLYNVIEGVGEVQKIPKFEKLRKLDGGKLYRTSQSLGTAIGPQKLVMARRRLSFWIVSKKPQRL
jgi:phage FluMu protein gp41